MSTNLFFTSISMFALIYLAYTFKVYRSIDEEVDKVVSSYALSTLNESLQELDPVEKSYFSNLYRNCVNRSAGAFIKESGTLLYPLFHVHFENIEFIRDFKKVESDPLLLDAVTKVNNYCLNKIVNDASTIADASFREDVIQTYSLLLDDSYKFETKE